jgi:hypothetical protein
MLGDNYNFWEERAQSCLSRGYLEMTSNDPGIAQLEVDTLKDELPFSCLSGRSRC